MSKNKSTLRISNIAKEYCSFDKTYWLENKIDNDIDNDIKKENILKKKKKGFWYLIKLFHHG